MKNILFTIYSTALFTLVYLASFLLYVGFKVNIVISFLFFLPTIALIFYSRFFLKFSDSLFGRKNYIYISGIFVSGFAPLLITLNEKSNFISQNYFLMLICLTIATSLFVFNLHKDSIIYFWLLLTPFVLYWVI